MRYTVQFQEFNPKGGRPMESLSASDFETDDNGFGMIPNVGDIINIIGMSEQDASFSGRVRSRLFTYMATGDGEHQHCNINIVVEPDESIDWGALIKE